jgi:hypothetical protein
MSHGLGYLLHVTKVQVSNLCPEMGYPDTFFVVFLSFTGQISG